MRLQIFLLISFIASLLFPKVSISQDKIDVAENTFKVGGMGQESFYYGFAEGDQVIFSFEEANGKELKEIEIIEYPSSSKFMDYKTKKVSDKILNIQQTGVYQFRFVNSSISGRVCRYKIQRIPASPSTKNFNTTVYWQTVYDTTYQKVQERYLKEEQYVPTEIMAPTEFYINSGSNATFVGGKSRITVPVNLPENTVEWYYQFSASRKEEEIAATKARFALVSNLSKLIDKTKSLSFAINQLTQPPGADHCDIFLLDRENSQLFEAKTDFSYFSIGTRENLKSGVVRINKGIGGLPYIGIRNPDNAHGVHVVLEVVAIVYKEVWDKRDVEKMDINSKRIPYIKN